MHGWVGIGRCIFSKHTSFVTIKHHISKPRLTAIQLGIPPFANEHISMRNLTRFRTKSVIKLGHSQAQQPPHILKAELGPKAYQDWLVIQVGLSETNKLLPMRITTAVSLYCPQQDCSPIFTTQTPERDNPSRTCLSLGNHHSPKINMLSISEQLQDMKMLIPSRPCLSWGNPSPPLKIQANTI